MARSTSPRFGPRPASVAGRVGPGGDGGDLRVADRSLEARHPAVAVSADAFPGVIRYSRARRVTEIAEILRGDLRRVLDGRDDEPRARHRSERTGDDEVAAAQQRRRMRLLEDDLADAEQRHHHRDAEPEPGREHRRPDRTRHQRSPGDSQHHGFTAHWE